MTMGFVYEAYVHVCICVVCMSVCARVCLCVLCVQTWTHVCIRMYLCNHFVGHLEKKADTYEILQHSEKYCNTLQHALQRTIGLEDLDKKADDGGWQR